MRILLAGMMALLLLRAPETMAAAEAACALFVRSVMPGLFPYLTLSQMLVSRCGRDMQPGMLMLLGWCGGSPTGARLLAMQGSRPHREQKALEQPRQAEAAREEARARLEENTLARRLVDAFTNRRNPKRDAPEGEKSREEEEIK